MINETPVAHLESNMDSPKQARATLLSGIQKLNELVRDRNKLVGDAHSAAEEAALFADGYQFVVRWDLVSGGSNTAPTSTIIFSDFTNENNTAPVSTIIFSNFT
jgi:hypothetical protein